MNSLTLNGQSIELDKQGYLADLTQWSPALAEALGQQENIQLTEPHWELIQLCQQFYQEFDHSPGMRILVKYVKQQVGEEKGNSIYLMQLFPGSPAKLIAKIAGLPRPTNCL